MCPERDKSHEGLKCASNSRKEDPNYVDQGTESLT